MQVNPDQHGLAQRIDQMPKVELHVHIEGAIDAQTIWELSRRNCVPLPADSLSDWLRHYKFRNFQHFIRVYGAAVSTICNLEDWQLIVERFVDHQADQYIVYTEAFVSASLHLERFPADEWLDATQLALTSACARRNVEVKLIPDIARQQPESAAKVTNLLAAGLSRGLFIGLGLGGAEASFPPGLFVDAYAEAKRLGAHVVAHAGEAAGAESIWGALELLGAERIGHGIRCLEDPELIEHLRNSQIPLEVCPNSNFCCGIVPWGTPHPIQGLMEAGLLCTLNSDDPAMFGANLNSEFRSLVEAGVSWEEIVRLNLNAVQASFMAEADKLRITAMIQTAIAG